MKKRMICIFLFVLQLYLCGCHSQAASIGIIGGADGPTAVFVTSHINRLYVWASVGGIAAVLLVTGMIRRNRKKK